LVAEAVRKSKFSISWFTFIILMDT
jgi:hypothetical protein